MDQFIKEILRAIALHCLDNPIQTSTRVNDTCWDILNDVGWGFPQEDPIDLEEFVF